MVKGVNNFKKESSVGQRIPVTLGNIAPLSVMPFLPGTLALVCEGGGQRGIFTAGVLDEFMRARFDPFNLYLGTSAGAQNLSAYLCNQPGYARKVITRYTTSRDFFDPMRFVRGGHLIDLDWLIDATSSRMPLAMDAAARHFDNGKQFFICASRADDYTPGYFSPTKETWLEQIRASSAIPGFYRSGVQMEGANWLDGGVSDAVPVQEAVRRGAKTVVVIRTVPSQMYYTPQWFKRMERWLGESSLQPFVNLVQHHEKTYHAIQQFIEKPPGDIRIFEIYPPKPLKSMALGSRLPALLDDYNVGRQCGRYFLATVGKLLAELPPLRRFKPRIVAPAPVVMPAATVANDALGGIIADAPQTKSIAAAVAAPAAANDAHGAVTAGAAQPGEIAAPVAANDAHGAVIAGVAQARDSAASDSSASGAIVVDGVQVRDIAAPPAAASAGIIVDGAQARDIATSTAASVCGSVMSDNLLTSAASADREELP